MDSSQGDISTVIGEAASLNYKSIFLRLSQVEIPAKKRKNLTIKIVNSIANDIQQDNLNKLKKNQSHYRYEKCEKEHLRDFKLVRKTIQKMFNISVLNVLVLILFVTVIIQDPAYSVYS